MISVYALLCSAALLHSVCTPLTAIDVVRLPDADNELSCLRDSMVTVASLAIQPKSGEYWKFVCSRGTSAVVDNAKEPQFNHSIPGVLSE